MPTQAQLLSDRLFDEFTSAETEADREAIRPAALAAAERALDDAIRSFRGGTLAILDLASKLEAAVAKVGSPGSRQRLKTISLGLGEIARGLHDAEGMRTTWQTNEEFESVFEDEKLVPSSGLHDEIPVGPPIMDPARQPQLSASREYQFLADEYVALFRLASYKDSAADKAAKRFAETAALNRGRYESVGNPIGVPWWFAAGVHLLESSYNFNTHLHNGDPLAARTFRIPAARPRGSSPPFRWEQSAVDALKGDGLAGLSDWSLARALYRWEAYNGFGYRSRGVPSPYLWSYSTVYQKGKFIGDGVFSFTAVSKQCGAAVLLKALIDLGEVSLQVEHAVEGDADPAESEDADAEAVVSAGAPNIDGVISANVDFQAFFEARLPGIRHFNAHEFFVKGGSHATNRLNTDPPMELWPNMVQLARVLDRLREEIGKPIVLTSVYRSPNYNAVLPGAAKASQHMLFRAADFKIVGAGKPADWARVLRRYRDDRMFEGGIGLYKTFVHVDTRGVNATWDNA